MVLLTFPSENFLIKFYNQNFRTMSEICWVVAIKIPVRRKWHLSYIVNFEQISHVVLMFVWKGTCAGTCRLDKNCDSKVFWICALEVWQNLWRMKLKKIFSARFQVKITKCKTCRIFTDSTKAYYNSDNPKNIFRIRLVRNGFLFVLCEIYRSMNCRRTLI